MNRLVVLFSFLILTKCGVYAQLNPSIEWVNIYDGIGKGIDMINDAKIDKEFNLYLAGRSAGVDGRQDLLILKYTRLGKLISEIRYVSAPASWEEVNSIAIDSTENIYCIGSASFYAIIQKYSSEGNIIWNKDFYNTSGQYSEGAKIAIDKSNNIIAGYHLNGACFTKYTSSGDSLWTVRISDEISNYNINNIITDFENNIYSTVTQSSFNDSSDVPETKVIFLKYDPYGKIIWNKTLNVNSSRKLIFDNKSNLLLVTNDDGKVLKFNSNGDSIWCFDSYGILSDIKVDKENNILLSGFSGGIGGSDYMITKLNSFGNEIWSATFNSNENMRDYASAITVDNDDNIYVTGAAHDMITQGVCNTLKYNPDGELLWQYKYDAPHSIFENPSFIFLDDSNNVFIGGDVADSTNGLNFFALKITQKLGTNIEQHKSFLPSKYSLKQNYPNPFNPTTTISYQIKEQGLVHLKVYNLLGQEIATLVNEDQPAGIYEALFDASNLPSGVYIYSLRVNDFVQNSKMTLLK